MKPTTERLAEAMEAAGCPQQLIANARAGRYDDYKSPLVMPLHALVEDLRGAGYYPRLIDRVAAGEFDGTAEEAKAWAASAEGQAVFRDLVEGR